MKIHPSFHSLNKCQIAAGRTSASVSRTTLSPLTFGDFVLSNAHKTFPVS